MIAAFAAPAAPAALSPTLVSLRGTKGRQSNFINYLDANHLYGLAMSMKLPIGKLKWIKKILFRVVTKHANLKTYQKNLTAIWGLCRCNFPIWKLVDDLGGPPLGRCTRKVLLLRGARNAVLGLVTSSVGNLKIWRHDGDRDWLKRRRFKFSPWISGNYFKFSPWMSGKIHRKAMSFLCQIWMFHDVSIVILRQNQFYHPQLTRGCWSIIINPTPLLLTPPSMGPWNQEMLEC